MIALPQVAGLFQHIRGEHLAAKVAFVQLLVADDFVDALKFREGKFFGQ